MCLMPGNHQIASADEQVFSTIVKNFTNCMQYSKALELPVRVILTFCNRKAREVKICSKIVQSVISK